MNENIIKAAEKLYPNDLEKQEAFKKGTTFMLKYLIFHGNVKTETDYTKIPNMLVNLTGFEGYENHSNE